MFWEAFAWSIVLSIVLYFVLSPYLSAYPSFYRSIYRFIYLSIHRSIDLSTDPSIYRSICRSINRLVYRSIYAPFRTGGVAGSLRLGSRRVDLTRFETQRERTRNAAGSNGKQREAMGSDLASISSDLQWLAGGTLRTGGVWAHSDCGPDT